MLIDISWPLTAETISYKNRHPIQLQTLRTVAEHSVCDSLCTSFHLHTGTHIDAPSHILADGVSIEHLSLEKMNGPCRVIDLSLMVGEKIEASHLLPYNIVAGERILLKTQNSARSWKGEYCLEEVFLASSAADYLASLPVALVGIDALGLERNQTRYASHTPLLKANVIVVEGLRLAHAAEGIYELLLLPLAFKGVDAAPARAVLRTMEK